MIIMTRGSVTGMEEKDLDLNLQDPTGPYWVQYLSVKIGAIIRG